MARKEFIRGSAAGTPVEAASDAPPVRVDPSRVFATREPISATALVEALRRSDAGAVATFEGTVRAERDSAGGRELAALEYVAYEEMAIEQMALLRDKALREFAVLDVALAHRLGRLPLGEVSVAVAVVAAHRAAAFDACRWLIDTLKVDVPIWKKAVWSDGGANWTDPLADAGAES
ncbi:MAG: molybdenum cofactor biosynthesis protein MoaE [Phycisphaerae bacterium]|nr:molybdenum cofactor biosynthesis protein MoaE [Phycisphaerae bacterium]